VRASASARSGRRAQAHRRAAARPSHHVLRHRGGKAHESAKIALAALQEAVSGCGELPPASNHIRANVKAVKVDTRTYAERGEFSFSEGAGDIIQNVHSKCGGSAYDGSRIPRMRETTMRFSCVGMLLFWAAALVVSAIAQPTPSPPAAIRTVVAATKLPNVVETPLYFRALGVSIPSRESTTVSAANGILYQISGSTEVSVSEETRTLRAGEGLFIGAGKTASLRAGNDEPSVFLHFLLAPAVDQPVETAPATVKELYRTAAPLPDLKPGRYDLNLTRVTFPARMPSNPPHHRSGAALYYIISGTGTNTIEGKAEAKGPGSLIYEPFGLVHQWGNPGDAPFTFLSLNINPEGVAAVVQGSPSKSN
jgi:quercetin dioxygenase-like cupin family protein